MLSPLPLTPVRNLGAILNTSRFYCPIRQPRLLILPPSASDTGPLFSGPVFRPSHLVSWLLCQRGHHLKHNPFTFFSAQKYLMAHHCKDNQRAQPSDLHYSTPISWHTPYPLHPRPKCPKMQPNRATPVPQTYYVVTSHPPDFAE